MTLFTALLTLQGKSKGQKSSLLKTSLYSEVAVSGQQATGGRDNGRWSSTERRENNELRGNVQKGTVSAIKARGGDKPSLPVLSRKKTDKRPDDGDSTREEKGLRITQHKQPTKRREVDVWKVVLPGVTE